MLASALADMDERDAQLYPGDRPARGAGGGGRGGKGRGGRGGGGRRSGGGGGGEDDRERRISMKMSYVLRHGAKKEGLKIDEGGWVRVDELLQWRVLRSMHVTWDELQRIVETNAKKRYELAPLASPLASQDDDNDAAAVTTTATEPPSIDFETSDTAAATAADPTASLSALQLSSPPPASGPSAHRIRAVQGHTLNLDAPSIYERLDPTAPTCPAYVVHGTNPSAWSAIQASGGLRRMGRSHVHFATGTGDAAGDARVHALLEGAAASLAADPAGPAGATVDTTATAEGSDVVISGLRGSATVMIWVALRPKGEQVAAATRTAAAEASALPWWRSVNGVVLSEGNDKGMVPLECVALVEQRKRVKGGGAGWEREVLWAPGDFR